MPPGQCVCVGDKNNPGHKHKAGTKPEGPQNSGQELKREGKHSLGMDGHHWWYTFLYKVQMVAAKVMDHSYHIHCLHRVGHQSVVCKQDGTQCGAKYSQRKRCTMFFFFRF